MPRRRSDQPLVSHTGMVLDRATTFKFVLDPNQAQQQQLLMFAGAARYTFNHHLGRVKANLDQRAAEKTYGLTGDQLTPALAWSQESFINAMNAYKNGTSVDSPTNPDGSRGLAWRAEVSTDVFECASVNAATALKNFSDSRTGTRKGAQVGFPQFKAKHRETPSFRLRNRARPGTTQVIRVTGSKTILLPKLGELRIHGCTRKLRRMIQAGRFHVYSATISFSRGQWWVAVNGLAAQFHHQRRCPKNRHPHPGGIDRGVKTLPVGADREGQPWPWPGSPACTRRLRSGGSTPRTRSATTARPT